MSHHLEDWERSIDEELYFLTQDGYAGKWAEMKKEDIKSIIRSLMFSLQQKIEGMKEIECTYGHTDRPQKYCDACVEKAAVNKKLSDVLALFPKETK